MLSRRHFIHTVGIGAAAGAALAASPFPLRAFEPSRHGQAVGAKTALGAQRASAILLNSNENAYGPLPKTIAAMREALVWANRYPDFDYDALVWTISDLHKVQPQQVITGCGSTEILRATAMAFLAPGKKLITAWPTFEAIAEYADAAGAEVVKLPLTSSYANDLDAMLAQASNGPALVHVCNPNNPTASLTPRKDLETFISRLPSSSYILIDEAYHHFAVGVPEYTSFLDQPVENPRVIVARTFSKVYGMAGMRLGYGISSLQTTERLRRYQTQDNVNMVAAQAGVAALQDPEEMQAAARRNATDRHEFFAQAARRNVKVIPSYANFAMLDAGRPAKSVADYFRQNGILVGRPFPLMDNFVRVSFGRPNEMQQFWRLWDALKNGYNGL
ncbi:MAG TPA: aminotransferase class I/II-fold pyridoxal phosphate-dependent enzyme [Terriglobales bacterium]|nr:aminotransferase class I/II-fold pyridoxal phosphate-dependent enzyme [Terriglobales bacterium]